MFVSDPRGVPSLAKASDSDSREDDKDKKGSSDSQRSPC